MPSRRLDDDVAFITGASAGIGAATALALAKEGARLWLGARRTDRLEEVARRIAREVPGARVGVAALDVRDGASVQRWLDAAPAPCTVLVNNAGLVLGRRTVAELDLDELDTVLDTNVKAVFALTRRALPQILAGGRGDVVMIASIAGTEPYANGSVYCASKAALQAFSSSLRAEMLGKDVRVLCFDPGMVETEFSIVRFGGDDAAARQVYAGMRPVTADDVADCVAFALTRPRHVSLDRMQILATDQLGTRAVHRR